MTGDGGHLWGVWEFVRRMLLPLSGFWNLRHLTRWLLLEQCLITRRSPCMERPLSVSLQSCDLGLTPKGHAVTWISTHALTHTLAEVPGSYD